MEFPELGAHCSWPACQRLGEGEEARGAAGGGRPGSRRRGGRRAAPRSLAVPGGEGRVAPPALPLARRSGAGRRERGLRRFPPPQWSWPPVARGCRRGLCPAERRDGPGCGRRGPGRPPVPRAAEAGHGGGRRGGLSGTRPRCGRPAAVIPPWRSLASGRRRQPPGSSVRFQRAPLLDAGRTRSEEEPCVFLTLQPFCFRGGSGGKRGPCCGSGLRLQRVRETLGCGRAALTSLLPALLPDFLPLKCDACEQIFCTDHIAYAQHDCTSAYKKVSAERGFTPACRVELPSVPNRDSE